jgi:hypothetical protein
VKTCQSFPSSLCRVRRNAIAAFGTRNSSGLARLKRLKVNCFEARVRTLMPTKPLWVCSSAVCLCNGGCSELQLQYRWVDPGFL